MDDDTNTESTGSNDTESTGSNDTDHDDESVGNAIAVTNCFGRHAEIVMIEDHLRKNTNQQDEVVIYINY